jgi:hypothetical protein
MSKYFYSGGKSLKGGSTSTEYDASTDITVRGGSFNGNITQSSGTANLQAVSCSSLTATGAVSGTTLSGSLSTASQPNITSLGTLTSLTASGAISGATLGGSLTTASQGNITTVGTLQSLSVTGNISAGNVSTTQVTATLVSGSLTTASQANITTVGTLGSLTVSGNISAGAVSQSAPVALIYRNTGQTVSNNTSTVVTWGTASKSSGSGLTINNSTSIKNTSGSGRWVYVAYSIQWTANSTNSRQIYLLVDGTTGNVPNADNLAYSQVDGAGGGGDTCQTGSAVVYLANNGGCNIYVYQDSGSSLSLQGYLTCFML